MSAEQPTRPTPDEAATNEAPPAPAPTTTPPAEAAKEPAADPAPEPPKVDLAAEVMKRRDAKELAALSRQQRQLEAERTKLKELEPKAASFARAQRLAEDGDRVGAISAMLEAWHGDAEKAKAALADYYNDLTAHVLAVQNAPQNPSKLERRVSRHEEDLEALKRERDQAKAEAEELKARDHEQRVQGAIQQVASFLRDSESEFPHLTAEADAPEDVVWGILEEAMARGEDLTLEQAAKLADEYFKPAVERKKTRYQNLLAPKKANGVPPKSEAPTSPMSAPPRKSLTNADASQAPQPQELPPPRNEDERLARSFAVLQQGLSKR